MTGPSPSAYHYQNRQGIRPITWQDFHGLCKGLASAKTGQSVSSQSGHLADARDRARPVYCPGTRTVSS
jgi:hypothetical protein